MKNFSAFDRLVSFDITNPFTQVPVDEALKVLEERLSVDKHSDGEDQHPCAPADRAHRNMPADNFFQLQDTFYEQLDGLAMGPLLSPSVANLYMEHQEETARGLPLTLPYCGLSYVDDTLEIWPHGLEKLDCFHEHLNMQHRSIKFTVEHKKHA